MNIHLRRLVQFLLIGTFLLACVAGWYVQSGSSTNKAHAARAKDPIVTITINPGVTIKTINSDFLGFSAETGNACDIANLALNDPEFVQLIKNLSPTKPSDPSPALRIGGGTVENSHWMPNRPMKCTTRNTNITQALLNGIFGASGFAGKTGWKITWQLPLKRFINSSMPVTEDVQEAQAVVSAAAAINSLLSIEIGNEPEYYSTVQSYLSAWNKVYNALPAPKPPLSGPATEHLDRLMGFVNAEASKVRFASLHYFNQKCGDKPPFPTIAGGKFGLLNPTTISNTVSFFNTALTDANGLPLAVNATNSYCHGGASGVSNVFASALWAVDYAFTAAKMGIRYLDFLGVPNDRRGNSSGENYFYAPINLVGTNSVAPAPLYYGLLLYHYATISDGSIVSTTIAPSSPVNVTAYTVLGSDGHLRLVIINKDLGQNATVNVNTTQHFTSATALSLLAPSISATSGITLGGASIGSNGTLTPTASPVSVSGANSSITVPAGSAVVITYM